MKKVSKPQRIAIVESRNREGDVFGERMDELGGSTGLYLEMGSGALGIE